MQKLKQKINAVIVVEGKTDKDKLLTLFDCEIITTNGSAINKKTIELIKKVSETKKVILFLDPDFVGEKIRKIIQNNVKNVYHCFISANDMEDNSKKIGIAEAKNDAIINAISSLKEFNPNNNSISLNEFNELNINSKNKRIFICNWLKISYCNNKQLLKRLNMLNIDLIALKQILNEYNYDEK